RDRRAKPGDEVLLDGSLSYDRDEDRIRYRWELFARPAGSKAEIKDPDAAKAKFTADVPGTYVARLRVFDGKAWSAAKPDVGETLPLRLASGAISPAEAEAALVRDPSFLRAHATPSSLSAAVETLLGRPLEPPTRQAVEAAAAGHSGNVLGATVDSAPALL